MKSKAALAAMILLVLGLASYLAEQRFYGGVDADGVLQESFFLPLSFILVALGIVMLLVSLALRWRQ